jgi:hypothetical protein
MHFAAHALPCERKQLVLGHSYKLGDVPEAEAIENLPVTKH